MEGIAPGNSLDGLGGARRLGGVFGSQFEGIVLVSELLAVFGLELGEPVVGLDLSLLFFCYFDGFVPFVLLLLDLEF